jgi:ABC-type sugar transport system ATPase subunit
VLRDGRLVSTQRVAETDEEALIARMINRSIDQIHYKEVVPFGDEVLRTEGLSARASRRVRTRARGRGGRALRPDRRRAQRVRASVSPFPDDRRTDLWNGRPVDIRREADAIALGIALVPEAAVTRASASTWASAEPEPDVYERLTKGGIISRSTEAAAADGQIRGCRSRPRPGTGWSRACRAATSRRSWSASG